MGTMIFYGWLKLDILVSRKNPNIFNSVLRNELDSSDEFNMKSFGHKFAFSAIHISNGESVIDSRFVQFVVLLLGIKDDDEYQIPI